MSQGPLCPNLTKKFQKKVSQMVNQNLPIGMLLRLNHLKIFKQNRIISICSILIEYLLIQGVPPWGWMVGRLEVGGGNLHACMYTYDIIGNSQGLSNGSSHLHEIIMFIIHAFACVCMYTYVGLPHPPTPPSTHPPAQGATHKQ